METGNLDWHSRPSGHRKTLICQGNCRHAGAKAVPLGAGLLPATRGNLRLAEPVKSVFCLVITDFNPTEHLNLRLCPKCKTDCMDRVHIQTFGDTSCVGPISIDVWERFG